MSNLRETEKEKMRGHEREHFSQSICFFIQICLLWSLFVLLRFWQLEAINFRITRLIELDLWSLQLVIHFCFLDEVKDYSRMNNENEADFPLLKHLENFCWWKVTPASTNESKCMRWGKNLWKSSEKIAFSRTK